MDDIIYIIITLAFFAVAAIYIQGLKRLQPEADNE